MCGLARKIKTFPDRLRQSLRCRPAADGRVAVGAATERLAHPVAYVRTLQLPIQKAAADAEHFGQAIQRDAQYFPFRLASQRLARRPARPAREHWRTNGQRRPPRGKCLTWPVNE